MANLRQIRRRIRSVRNTAKVTKAMEMVAASKMRRAQQRVLQGRPYAERLRELLSHLAAQTQGERVPPLLERRPVRRIGLLYITPDRGLCGGLPANQNRAIGQFLLEKRREQVPAEVIAVGRKGRDFMVRYYGELRAVFTNLSDRPGLADTHPISHLVIEDYASGYVDQVFIAYPQFVNVMTQRPVIEQLLPVQPAAVEPHRLVGYIYEPDSREVLEALLPRYVHMQVYHAMLEAIASEQSARMVAMRNATENANSVIEDLTLLMNKVRQETITKELLDIAGGVVALE